MGSRGTASYASSAAELVCIASERADILSQLSAVEELQARLNILLVIALENELPIVREDGRRLQSNVPMQRCISGVRSLRVRQRRVPGVPFFVTSNAKMPPPHADAVSYSAEVDALQTVGKEDLGASWMAADDAALEEAVYLVARMHAAERVFARCGVVFPAHLRPLGKASPHRLSSEPRAIAQYDTAVAVWQLQDAASAAQLPAAAAAAFVRAAADAFALPRHVVLRNAGADLDWIRVAHGGFFPLKSVQSAHDCRVRWLAHACPTARARSVTAAFASEWDELEDSALTATAAVAGRSCGLGRAFAAQRLLAARRPLDCARRFLAVSAPATSAPAPAPPFSADEDAAILNSARYYGIRDFSSVLHAKLPHRSRAALIARYEALARRGAFSAEDDARLRLLVRVHGRIEASWAHVQACMHEHSERALRMRWKELTEADNAAAEARAEADGAAFSAAEDDALLRDVAARGTADWAATAARLAAEAPPPQAVARRSRDASAVRWRYAHIIMHGSDSAGGNRKARSGASGSADGISVVDDTREEDSGDDDDGGVGAFDADNAVGASDGDED